MKVKLNPYSGLILAMFAASWASIFIRLCDAPALIIAFYRLMFASLFLVPLVARRTRQNFSQFSRRDILLSLISGTFLAFHFALWITSLQKTSVASSVVLVSTQPIITATFSALVLREKPSVPALTAILLALSGTFMISLGDFALGVEHVYGDILAIGGAVAASAYILIGRRVRRRVELLPYIFIVYFTSAVALAMMGIISGNKFFPYSARTFLFLILLALIPSLIGHTLLNWAVKYLRAYTVNLSALGEPIGASILAYLIFGETPSLSLYAGGVLILVGIWLGFREERKFGSTE